MEQLNILALKYAESTLQEDVVFRGGSPEKRWPITFVMYLLQAGDRTVLVDAGCDTMPGFEMVNYDRPVEVLKRYGYLAEDITDVIITHVHHDHIAAVGYYKNAVIHIQEDEYVVGKKYIPEDAKVNIFKQDYSLDENILVKKIGGHSKGSCVVEIRKDEMCYVISGDECYARECLTNEIMPGVSFNPQNSEEFIRTYSQDCYQVLLCHEKGLKSGYITREVFKKL